MTIPEFTPVPPLNRNAVFSFVLSLLAVIAFCSGFLPVPFTILLCYPPGVILGIVSLFLGMRARRELLVDGKGGRALAAIALWMSGMLLFAFICMIAAGAALTPRITEYVRHFLN